MAAPPHLKAAYVVVAPADRLSYSYPGGVLKEKDSIGWLRGQGTSEEVLNRVRFITPVHVGKRVRLRSKLLSVDEVQQNVYQMISENTVEIEGSERPAMVAESISRTYL